MRGFFVGYSFFTLQHPHGTAASVLQMSLKNVSIGAAVLLLASIGWRYRNAPVITAWMSPDPPAAAKIEFDNGTVRDYSAASQPGQGNDSRNLGSGGVRKCKKGAEIIYTNEACPQGAKEHQMTGGTISVVPGHGQPKPATPSPMDAPRRATVYDAMDASEAPPRRQER